MNNRKDNELVSVQTDILSYVDKVDLNELGYEDLVEMGRGVNEVKGYSKWLLGKLGDKVAEKYGDLARFARDIKELSGSLEQYVFAYRKYTSEDPDFTPDKYYGQVPWGMILLVAGKTDKPVTMLNELVENGVVSTEHAYREIKTKETGVNIPAKPKIRLVWNMETEKWKLKVKSEEARLIDWSEVKEWIIGVAESVR